MVTVGSLLERKLITSLCVPYNVTPTMRVPQLGKVARNASLILAEVINDNALAQEGTQVGIRSQARLLWGKGLP